MDFFDFYLKNKLHIDAYSGLINFDHGREDFLNKYSELYYGKIEMSEGNNPCFILFLILQRVLEGKKTEVNHLLRSLGGDYKNLFGDYQLDNSYSYFFLICSKDKSDNDENEVYQFLKNHFEKKIKESLALEIKEIKELLDDLEDSVVIMLGHGNDSNGIHIQAKNSEIYLLHEICNLPKKACYMFLNCAYMSIKELSCFKDLDNSILANNNIGPTHQVAFTSFFCKSLDLGLDLRTSFILAEIGCSTYFYTTTGTELYVKGNKREKISFI